MDNNGNIVNFSGGNTGSFKYKIKTGKKPTADNTKNVKIAVLLKYLGNF